MLLRIYKMNLLERKFMDVLNITKKDFIKICKKLKIKNPTSLFNKLLESGKDESQDDIYTKKLSSVWYQYQVGMMRRLNHKRIYPKDSQWKVLIKIKNELLNKMFPDKQMIRFSQLALMIFKEAEKISKKAGKKSLYLPFVLSTIDETFDNATDSEEYKVTTRHQKIFKCYKNKRERFTNREWDVVLSPGSEEHKLISKIDIILKDYNIGKKKFMKIQFDAFGFHKTFPKLKDLVTSAAIDRLDIALAKENDDYKPKDAKDEAYWNKIKKRKK